VCHVSVVFSGSGVNGRWSTRPTTVVMNHVSCFDSLTRTTYASRTNSYLNGVDYCAIMQEGIQREKKPSIPLLRRIFTPHPTIMETERPHTIGQCVCFSDTSRQRNNSNEFLSSANVLDVVCSKRPCLNLTVEVPISPLTIRRAKILVGVIFSWCRPRFNVACMSRAPYKEQFVGANVCRTSKQTSGSYIT